jgi:hypothetical protein
MKPLLLLSLLMPFALSARVDPRIPKTASYGGVKSMKTEYIFIIAKGNDTAITETFQYNEAGFLVKYDYDLHMMKNPNYSMSSIYTYRSNDAWTATSYKNNKMSDSAVVKGAWANHYWWHEGKLSQINEFRGDTFAEKNISDGDTTLMHQDIGNAAEDDFWDYRHAGEFARKSYARSTDSDTTCYIDEIGKCMVMVVNFYDSNFKPVKTNYYNYSVKRFDLFYLPHNERTSMVFFLNKSSKGKWSFEITRKYNEEGWLIEEYFTDARPNSRGNSPPMLKKYTYELYQ